VKDSGSGWAETVVATTCFVLIGGVTGHLCSAQLLSNPEDCDTCRQTSIYTVLPAAKCKHFPC
jgi:hypothetical protein